MSAEDEVEDPGNAVGGYAPALHFCPHADANIIQLPYGTETKEFEPDDNQCSECDNREENWLCLSCHTIHCGRFASSHARKHANASGHRIACGLADLSFWCYDCDSYLHHLAMQPVYTMYRTLHVMKFGEDTVEVMEFTQPGVFSVQDAGEEKGEEPERKEPLSLSAGMSGGTSATTENKPDDESEQKADAAAQTTNTAAVSSKQ